MAALNPSSNSFMDIRFDVPYIVDKVQVYMHNLVNEFLTKIGIENTTQDKRERMVADETNANIGSVEMARRNAMRPARKSGERSFRKMGVTISVEFNSHLKTLLNEAFDIFNEEDVDTMETRGLRSMINHSLPQYTITIDYIIRGLLHTDFEHTLTDAEIKEALPLIFDFDYGIDTQYKMFFEYSFIRHYLFREIAVTPLERWKQYLQEFCFANYKYIEVVCKAAQTDFNPLVTFSYAEDGVSNRKTNEQSNSTGNTENETTNTGAGQEVNSAFPQATLNDMDYASGATQSENNDHSQSSGTNHDKRRAGHNR